MSGESAPQGIASLAPPPTTATESSSSSTATPQATEASKQNIIQRARHPTVCIFHILFKAIVLVCYLLGRYLMQDYVVTFILCTVFSSFDFWVTKNISGRKLVGLRWWNEVLPDGSSEWVFESIADESIVDAADKTVFWTVIYTWPIVWTVFLILNLIALELNWVLLISVAFLFAAANVIGYVKCSRDAQKRARDWAQGTALQVMARSVM
eukprot:gnl/MRDRNA2_/MRDRNA2_19486_c0_seq1.p1 gnl/MRDRNA2_/MRDRNA2_19486_c0~~gnl/MRDRNA2_/MRDRNA2_19486_c0_seq1.p1  ORF type:complete len:210 (+),score=26.93 gnl/MRDRNA2_/MRDRNA2_19486_c0_seq1:85-714(+)